jgi:hypothetical protein
VPLCVRATSSLASLVAICTLASCSDSSGPAAAPRLATVRAQVAALPVANATVRVLAGLDGTVPVAINDSDVAIAWKEQIVNGTVVVKTFRWDPKTGIHVLANNPFSFPAGVNDVGTVIAAGPPDVWLPSGQVRPFQSIADSNDGHGGFALCAMSGINRYSAIVGNCDVHGFITPVIYHWHGPAQEFGFDVPNYNAISDDGWIGAGLGQTPTLVSPTGQNIVLKSRTNTIDIGSVYAITNHGWAAGEDFEGRCPQFSAVGEAVAWLSTPTQPHAEFAFGVCGQSRGITDDWHVVGFASDSMADSASMNAFVWFPGPGLQRLPALGTGREYSVAAGINAHHHVLGSITSNGVRHIVLWELAH